MNTEKMRWALGAVLLLIVLMMVSSRWSWSGDREAERGYRGRPVSALAPPPIGKGSSNAGLQRDIDRFLTEHEGDPFAVLAVSYLYGDAALLRRVKGQFRDDPVFAFHYLSANQDDPEFDRWLETLSKRDPDNAAGVYLKLARLEKNAEATADEALALLKESALKNYDIHSAEIESMAITFLQDFRGESGLEASRKLLVERTTPNVFPLDRLAKILKEHISGEDPAKRVGAAAALFNVGTNLGATGDPLHMTIGLAFERIHYEILKENEGLNFNVSPEEADEQIRQETSQLYRMVRVLSAEDAVEHLTEANHERFLEIRRTQGPVASVMYLENVESAE